MSYTCNACGRTDCGGRCYRSTEQATVSNAAYDALIAQRDRLATRVRELEAERDALFDQARIILYDIDEPLTYPMEHNPFTGGGSEQAATMRNASKDWLLSVVRARIATREGK